MTDELRTITPYYTHFPMRCSDGRRSLLLNVDLLLRPDDVLLLLLQLLRLLLLRPLLVAGELCQRLRRPEPAGQSVGEAALVVCSWPKVASFLEKLSLHRVN